MKGAGSLGGCKCKLKCWHLSQVFLTRKIQLCKNIRENRTCKGQSGGRMKPSMLEEQKESHRGSSLVREGLCAVTDELIC